MQEETFDEGVDSDNLSLPQTALLPRSEINHSVKNPFLNEHTELQEKIKFATHRILPTNNLEFIAPKDNKIGSDKDDSDSSSVGCKEGKDINIFVDESLSHIPEYILKQITIKPEPKPLRQSDRKSVV